MSCRGTSATFPGLGPHSFCRADISWRQEVGGSVIEASKTAGHRDLEVTGGYTFVPPERQNELTRRIQERLNAAVLATIGPPSARPDVIQDMSQKLRADSRIVSAARRRVHG